jgi:isopenicillin-N epimerase
MTKLKVEKTSKITRRTLLGLTANASAMVLASNADGKAARTEDGSIFNRRKFKQYQNNHFESFLSEIPLKQKSSYFNVGTSGSLLRSSINTLSHETLKLAETPRGGYGSQKKLRETIARGLGSNADEIIITGNTSDGCCRVLMGLEWHIGDEIITTNHEHEGGNSPLSILEDRLGVIIKRVILPIGNKQTAEDYTRLFEEQITPKTKAMFWSSPTYKTGTMLPIRDLVLLSIKHNLVTIVDGAHLLGMMAYKYSELGADFILSSGHKWQCGPLGTGVMYVRNRVGPANPLRLPKLWPTNSSGYSNGLLENRDLSGGRFFDLASVLQECGSQNTPAMKALEASCNLWDRIGRQNIQNRILATSNHLKNKIVDQWGIDSLYSPRDDVKLISGISSFNPFPKMEDIKNKSKSDLLVAKLESEYGIIVKNRDAPVGALNEIHYPIRVCTHIWNSEKFCDDLLEVISRVSKSI